VQTIASFRWRTVQWICSSTVWTVAKYLQSTMFTRNCDSYYK